MRLRPLLPPLRRISSGASSACRLLAGETVRVEVRPDYSYEVQILSVEKGQEDNDLPIAQY